MMNIVGPKGQIVIAKEIRDRLGIRPGWLALQRLVGDHVEVYFVPPEHRKSLKGNLAQYTKVKVATGRDWHEARDRAWNTLYRLQWYPVHGGHLGEFDVEPGVTLDDAVWNGDSGLPIQFDVWFEGNDNSNIPDYALELRREKRGWRITREKFLFEGRWLDTNKQDFKLETTSGPQSWAAPYDAPLAYLTQRFQRDSVGGPHVEPIQEMRARIGLTRRYRPSATDIASFTKPLADGKRGKAGLPEVDESGRGIALALSDMLGHSREAFSSLEKELQTLHGHVSGMTFKRDWRGIGLYYKTNRSGLDTPARLESDGVLLSTFLLWRMYSAAPNLKLCLEEPENGVHLSSLKQRHDILKRFASEGVGSLAKPQILVATHSRDFLNAIGSRTDILDEVRVVEFAPLLGTTIRRLDHWRQIDELLKESKYQIGDLWWSGRLQQRLETSG